MSDLDIDVVFFDLDGTLFDKKKAEKIALKKIIDNHEDVFQGVSFERLYEAFQEANQAGYKKFHNGVSLGNIRTERGEKMMDILSLKDSFADEFTAEFYEIYPSIHSPIDGAEKVVTETDSEYEIGIISNGSKGVQMAKLEVLGMTDKFEVVLFSEEVGIRKPDRKIFDLASDKIGHENKDCLYIGDSYKSDMIGARGAGMHTCWVNRDGKEKDGDYEPDLEITELPQLLEDI